MLSGHLNATRFEQKPIPQPSYSFSNVPKAEKDLSGSVVQKVENRDDFQQCMAEMLLVCKEATKRMPQQRETGGSKPLSLEYIADRLDVDEPCFGYLVRTNENLTEHYEWKKGMLQGFVTLTTFTNWQKSFEWDSTNVAAYEYDCDELAVASGLRKWDEDGTLSRALQTTVRSGDIWNEGIVWPRIAEISLLGALGCGRALVALAIEDLEGMKPTGQANYDYVALQATDNSIPFYESLGFVRVGTVMKDDANGERDRTQCKEVDGNLKEVPENYEVVRSQTRFYTIEKGGLSINDVARKFDIDPWDVVFLNQHINALLRPSTKLYKGTRLYLPVKPELDKSGQADNSCRNCSGMRWHVAKENETPRSIAKIYGVHCADIVEANKRRHPDLVTSSRLKEGTRLKVSHFDVPTNDFKPYSHWSFPDNEFEDGEPSYMMVRKLNRRKGRAMNLRPFHHSLAATFSSYKKTDLLMPVLEQPVSSELVISDSSAETELVVESNPKSAFMVFVDELRELADDQISNLSIGEVSKLFGDLWRDFPDTIKSMYEKIAAEEHQEFEQRKQQYGVRRITSNRSANLPCKQSKFKNAVSVGDPVVNQHSLYNTVVRLRPGAITEHNSYKYKYWYVLNFIPDLKWCHLAPMIQVGTFGDDKPRARGRPKWKLVDEALGLEVDITSNFCIPVNSKSMKKTLDADKEEWDIIDNHINPATGVNEWSRHTLGKSDESRETDSDSKHSNRQRSRKSPPTKPSVERKRKFSIGYDALNVHDDNARILPLDDKSLHEVLSPFAQQKRSRYPDSSTQSQPRNKRGSSSFCKESRPQSADENSGNAENTSSSEYEEDEESLSETCDSIACDNAERESNNRRKTRGTGGERTQSIVSIRSRRRALKSSSISRPKRAAAPCNFAEAGSDVDESSYESMETKSSDDSAEGVVLLGDETNMEGTKVIRKSSDSGTKPSLRPRRCSAPVFLGESQIADVSERLTPRRSNRTTTSTILDVDRARKRNTRLNAQMSSAETLIQRKAALSFIGEDIDRKPRDVKSAGSRRSVLQD